MATEKENSNEVYFFAPEDSCTDWKAYTGIRQDGKCYVPDKADIIKYSMLCGLDQIGKGIPIVTFKDHRYIRTDWMVKMFPETAEYMAATEKELRELYKRFKAGAVKRFQYESDIQTTGLRMQG
jgi:hypothetical protein